MTNARAFVVMDVAATMFVMHVHESLALHGKQRDEEAFQWLLLEYTFTKV